MHVGDPPGRFPASWKIWVGMVDRYPKGGEARTLFVDE